MALDQAVDPFFVSSRHKGAAPQTPLPFCIFLRQDMTVIGTLAPNLARTGQLESLLHGSLCL